MITREHLYIKRYEEGKSHGASKSINQIAKDLEITTQEVIRLYDEVYSRPLKDVEADYYKNRKGAIRA